MNEKDAFGYWQVAAKQRGEACVKISLGKLCTTLDHETLHVGIRVSCHISSSTTNPGRNADPDHERRKVNIILTMIMNPYSAHGTRPRSVMNDRTTHVRLRAMQTV